MILLRRKYAGIFDINLSFVNITGFFENENTP